MNDTEAFLKLDYSVLSIAKYDNISFSVLQKLIYCYYRDFYRSTNKPVYVSMSALATILGSDNRVTIQNSVKKLEVMGLLECVEANKGTSKKFIPKLLNLSLCTYTNSKKLRKGTNQDPERLVKPHKAEVKVKEEIKQNPMPTNEPEQLSEPVSEKPSVSTFGSVEPVTVPHVDDSDLTKWVLDQPVNHVESKPQETEEEQYYLGKKYFEMYEDFEVFYHKYPESRLTDNAKDVYRAFIKEADDKIPF